MALPVCAALFIHISIAAAALPSKPGRLSGTIIAEHIGGLKMVV